MGRNTSVSLGSYFENFVEHRILKGRYRNVSEVVRAGLRLLEEEENRAQALKNTIEEGLDSGIVENFNAKRPFTCLGPAAWKVIVKDDGQTHKSM
ncbi:MAG: type II toxin-antitoxin system ParD family antitoxin [Petrimonas sp.]|uniref:type II toxin-antitoxin system ParD family antitoxin n=1 Tax=Petrimonas sp. TaxID=2023866 RepID=UPI002B39ABDA|nr:type II toxin-antitoxin system ParD family antitoxin [Petrimonas sp.]MEA5044148.1 type II toxin-antitoxin system ParD family antitoxin [Petrimonas sp.]